MNPMRPPCKSSNTAAALVLFLLTAIGTLHSQSSPEFKINEIKPGIVLTPNIAFSLGAQKPARSKGWLEVEVSFNWNPRLTTEKFADDLVVNFYVLLSNKSAANPNGTLLIGQETLTSIPSPQIAANDGKTDLKTVMYASPRTLERFFDGKIPTSSAGAIVDIGVTISRQGQLLAQKSLKGNGAWWPQYQQTPGYLLNKGETPFASLNWDYYEAVKKQ
jgi:hypothetical protein